FESSSVPTTLPTAYDVYPLDGRHDGGYYTVKDCVTIDVLPRTPGNNVYVGFMVWSSLIQLTKLGYDATPFNQILKQNAKREMRLRLGKVTVADVLAAQPVTTNLLKFMRASIKMIGVSNLQSF